MTEQPSNNQPSDEPQANMRPAVPVGPVGPAPPLRAVCGYSENLDWSFAAEVACEQIRAALGLQRPQAVLIAVSGEHALRLSEVEALCQRFLGGKHTLAVATPTALHVDGATVGKGAVSVLALVSTLTTTLGSTSSLGSPFTVESFSGSTLAEGCKEQQPTPPADAVIMFADPAQVPSSTLMKQTRRWAGGPACIVGGFSPMALATGPRVVLNGEPAPGGVGGLALRGVKASSVTSTACRAVGRELIVTGLEKQTITGLAGIGALEALREVAQSLPQHDRELVHHGLRVGVLVDEGTETRGRADFAVRRVLHVDESAGTIVVDELLRVGQTVQLHVCDPEIAKADMELVLGAQSLDVPALAGIVVSGQNRLTTLMSEPSKDVELAKKALGAPVLWGCTVRGEFCVSRSEAVTQADSCTTLALRG